MNESHPKSRRLRASLLAGVCALGVVGFGASQNVFFGDSAAHAQSAPAVTAPLAPQAGPASFADVAEQVRKAVVSVKVKVETAADRSGGVADDNSDDNGAPQNLPPGMEEFFKRFGMPMPNGNGGQRSPFGQNTPRGHQYGMAQGSGFFITPDGYVVTNNHVVDHAVEVTLTMDDGRTVDAKVVGTDPKTDLALLKVKQAGDYPFVKFAQASPRVGDWVIAVGNPFGLGGTVTAGIVSARGRDIGAGPYDDFMQIDAAVNRGNSGGPTFNAAGEVVGVNTAIYSPSGGNVGIAFAIPASTAESVIESIKDTGKVTRGYIGVQIQPVTREIADSLGLKETKGALVAEVAKDGPALDAGIKAGDTIVSVDGKPVQGPKELSREIATLKPGSAVKVGLVRDGREETLSLKLGALPGDKTAKAETGADTQEGVSFGLALAPAKSVKGAGQQGVVVTQVDPEGAAADQGIKAGDVILEIGGKAVTEPTQVKQALADARKEGKKAVLMRLKSGEQSRFVALAFPKAESRG
ncbi:Do family serine endopeptidase [Alsobacter sp. SYSU M60028]|uniref:Probable periplasmic serine endoprotease DegP-like n=1 Tax=Alsobacter ponti TaxID=2962936 RepID=A0ABT1L892_9HYPH|nr:Do family serine endopeptidase [Alsobacter ponti]MCP8937725.1 Do family serine endopeptidase [Alsobacter ponti]